MIGYLWKKKDSSRMLGWRCVGDSGVDNRIFYQAFTIKLTSGEIYGRNDLQENDGSLEWQSGSCVRWSEAPGQSNGYCDGCCRGPRRLYLAQLRKRGPPD